MAPLREYSNWNVREAEDEEREPYKGYYLICEGENTERFYFEKIIDIRKELGIASNIKISYLEKTDEDRHSSNPKSLIELADRFVDDNDDSFDAELDEIILVFDLDIYEHNRSVFEKIVDIAKQRKYRLAVTNPSFELFLLLHQPGSLDNIIRPQEKEIITNAWVNGRNKKPKRYINRLFYNTFNMNPKSDEAVGALAFSLKFAIEQEKHINQDYMQSQGVLTSNVGAVLDNIIQNK